LPKKSGSSAWSLSCFSVVTRNNSPAPSQSLAVTPSGL
jgi:hypothetical protein